MGCIKPGVHETPPIFVSQLSKEFRGKKRQHIHALKNISLVISPGEVFGFLGPNGAGKSTTIKILMGLIRPSNGNARLFDISVDDPRARFRVGYLPENPAFYDFLTGREYLRFVGTAFSMTARAINKETAKVLSLLDLEAAADRPIRGYSKGMVQRLGLAQTLLHDPDLFILDEPMSGLDPIGRALVKEIILDLKRRGKTVFFSTHVTADVERVCDRIGVLIGGIFQEQRLVSDLLREGIVGYFCRVRGLAVETLQSMGGTACGDGIAELFVSRDRYDTFAAELLNCNGSFDLIEPRRRDVEEYFLSLVRGTGDT